jgi:ethanolamine utilization protein EutA
VYVSQPGELLPRRNLQVLHPGVHFHGPVDPQKLAAGIREHFKAFDLEEGEAEVALALRWRGEPSFERISGFAKGIAAGLARTIAGGKPVYLVLDGDVAHTLGAILKEDMGIASEVLVIDGIALRDFDYIDLGRIRMPSHTVPVTIKSLVFKEAL